MAALISPRFLAAEDVDRVINSCTGHVFELRDRAVLLLLARLALRASEVAQLKFFDIDWRDGGNSVCGKGRRQELLPLPQEVGDAILLYVNKGRHRCRRPRYSLPYSLRFTRSHERLLLISYARHCFGLGSKPPSTARTFYDIPPPRPCSARVHPRPAPVRSYDTALP